MIHAVECLTFADIFRLFSPNGPQSIYIHLQMFFNLPDLLTVIEFRATSNEIFALGCEVLLMSQGVRFIH